MKKSLPQVAKFQHGPITILTMITYQNPAGKNAVKRVENVRSVILTATTDFAVEGILRVIMEIALIKQ